MAQYLVAYSMSAMLRLGLCLGHDAGAISARWHGRPISGAGCYWRRFARRSVLGSATVVIASPAVRRHYYRHSAAIHACRQFIRLGRVCYGVTLALAAGADVADAGGDCWLPWMPL